MSTATATLAMAPDKGRERRSIRNFVIKKRFQSRWVGRMVGVALAIFASLGGYIYWYDQHMNERLLDGLARMGYGAEEVALMGTLYAEGDARVLWVLLILGVAMVTALASLGIVLTHRVAGPIYALGRFMDQVRDGRYARIRGFRKGDEFPELANTFQDLVTSLRTRETAELAVLQTLTAREDLSSEARSVLERLVTEKRARVG